MMKKFRINKAIYHAMNGRRFFCEYNKHNLPSMRTNFEKFMSQIKRFILRKIVMYRMLFYGSAVLIVFTVMRYSNNVNFAKNITPVFFLKNRSDHNTLYNVCGVIKPGSINYVKGTDECNFVCTDYEHEIKIYFKGILPSNFLEGNTVIAGGYITDPDRPYVFIATTLLTDHSYNSDKWLNRKLEKSNIKDNSGLIDEMMKRNTSKGYTNMR